MIAVVRKVTRSFVIAVADGTPLAWYKRNHDCLWDVEENDALEIEQQGAVWVPIKLKENDGED